MSAPRQRAAPTPRRAQTGVSLVELMIAITLGLVAVGAAMAIYLANHKSFALVEGVARTQENARFAVDLLSRDIREAGNAVCGGTMASVNIDLAGQTWASWSRGLVGNDWTSGFPAPTGGTAPIANTDSLLVWSASSGGTPVQITSHDLASGRFRAVSATGYVPGDVVTACDASQLVTFRVDSASNSSKTVNYINGSALTGAIAAGGFLNPLSANLWYVGKSTTGAASSLRRISNSSTGAPKNEEMVVGVTNMQIQYLVGDTFGAPVATTYVNAAAIADWKRVIAARITLRLATQDSVGNTGSANTVVAHDVPFTVGIKRRLP